ncbi:MAG TPA: GEVED domain-containing protein, partial [Flavobacteriales bacterium]|nr:GEVED domain-containing protein [Flavobacteriales bacterium]
MRTFSARTFILLGLSAFALGASAQSRLETHRAKRVARTAIAVHQPNGAGVERGGGYCTAGAEGSADFGLDEHITNVTFAGINNTSANVAPTLPAYTAYLGETANVTAGQSYPISIGVSSSLAGGTSFSEDQAIVWIDFNQDQDFLDAGETVFVSAIGAVTAYTGNVLVPATAVAGLTRMRVRMHDTHDGSQYINVFNDTPCGVASYGEVEDYSVNITAGGSAPANDFCANAQSITPGAACVGTFGDATGATQSLAASTCSGSLSTTANDVWFTFVATGTSTTVAVAGGGDATTGYDAVLEVFSGNCGALSSLGC